MGSAETLPLLLSFCLSLFLIDMKHDRLPRQARDRHVTNLLQRQKPKSNKLALRFVSFRAGHSRGVQARIVGEAAFWRWVWRRWQATQASRNVLRKVFGDAEERREMLAAVRGSADWCVSFRSFRSFVRLLVRFVRSFVCLVRLQRRELFSSTS